MVGYLIKGVVVGLLGLLAFLCRTKTTDRRDPRLLGEFALVVLTMLFVSERSWKHHYVTVLLPLHYLVSEFFSPRVGPRGRARDRLAWALSFSLMASTSPEIGGLFVDGQGHEIAQGYGSVHVGRRRPVRDGRLARLDASAETARVRGSTGDSTPARTACLQVRDVVAASADLDHVRPRSPRHRIEETRSMSVA